MFDPGIQKSQKTKPFPIEGISLDLALTSRCPLRCRYCSVPKIPYPEREAGEWIQVVESFARLRPIELISLEGGEPFLRPDLSVILEACLNVAERVKIVTSGAVPLDSLPLDLLHHPRFFLELSMDGPQEVHDFLRDGSWDRAWSFLITGLERHIPVRLRSVISRHNLPFMGSWLTHLDGQLGSYGPTVTFSYDTILFPEAMAKEGGILQRAGLNHYPARGLLPSPRERWGLFRDLKSRS
ncbi:MAG: radical SAM protein, partial [Deltaproteobacteria bacterium]|nr:radical SAM protein [Deltaproteobacteria bacterium]